MSHSSSPTFENFPPTRVDDDDDDDDEEDDEEDEEDDVIGEGCRGNVAEEWRERDGGDLDMSFGRPEDDRGRIIALLLPVVAGRTNAQALDEDEDDAGDDDDDDEA